MDSYYTAALVMDDKGSIEIHQFSSSSLCSCFQSLSSSLSPFFNFSLFFFVPFSIYILECFPVFPSHLYLAFFFPSLVLLFYINDNQLTLDTIQSMKTIVMIRKDFLATRPALTRSLFKMPYDQHIVQRIHSEATYEFSDFNTSK